MSTEHMIKKARLRRERAEHNLRVAKEAQAAPGQAREEAAKIAAGLARAGAEDVKTPEAFGGTRIIYSHPEDSGFFIIDVVRFNK